MAHIVVLARDGREAATYMKRAGLRAGRAIHATSAARLAGIIPSEVHELPRFVERPDSHAIRRTLTAKLPRYAKVEWKHVEMPDAPDDEVKDMGDGMGPQLTIDDIDVVDVPLPEPVSPNGDIPEKSSNGDKMVDEGAPVAPPEPPKRPTRKSRVKIPVPDDLFTD